MEIPRRCEVAVIGGGPAGSTAAALLAADGRDVVLLERTRHPRPHVGESLLPHAWKFLELSGAAARVAAEGFVAKAGGTVAWDGAMRQMSFRDLGYERPALHVERERFDHLLLLHAADAGAACFEGVAATSVDLPGGDGGEPVIRWRDEQGAEGALRCRAVLDASGQSGLLARQLGLRRLEPSHRMIAAWADYDGARYVDAGGQLRSTGEPGALARHPPTTLVEGDSEGGWCWHIALRARTSVGLVARAGDLSAGSTPAERSAWLDRALRARPALGWLLEDARIAGPVRIARDYSYHASRYAGPRWLLLGDAAAFVDPIFSLGVTFALYSGYLAAWTVDRTLRRAARAAAALERYHGQLDRRIALARALALPRYEPVGGERAAAQEATALESDLERRLRQTAAFLTGRPADEDLGAFPALEDGVEYRVLPASLPETLR